MIYFRMGLSALSAAGLLTKIITAAALLAALLAIYGAWHHKVFASGYRRAISDIAAQDNRAITRALAARSAFKDCRAQGKAWDQSTGKCS